MRRNQLMWIFILLTALTVLSIINLILFINSPTNKDIRELITRQLDNVKIETPKNGVTPIKGIDYIDGTDGPQGPQGVPGKDGKDGADGLNGRDGRTPVKGVDYRDGYTPIKGIDYFDGADGKDGEDGNTPEIRCNVNKNRWEVKYDPSASWTVLNGKPVKCTIGGIL